MISQQYWMNVAYCVWSGSTQQLSLCSIHSFTLWSSEGLPDWMEECCCVYVLTFTITAAEKHRFTLHAAYFSEDLEVLLWLWKEVIRWCRIKSDKGFIHTADQQTDSVLLFTVVFIITLLNGFILQYVYMYIYCIYITARLMANHRYCVGSPYVHKCRFSQIWSLTWQLD